MSSYMGRTSRIPVCVTLAVFALYLGSFQVQGKEPLYQCPDGWELRGLHCYRFFSIRHTWDKAAELCKRYGSDLVFVENYSQNNISERIAMDALRSENQPGPSSYWLGLTTLADLSTNSLESASKMVLSQYAGFWSLGQPDPKFGKCVRARLGDVYQSWELTTCEELLPFMCRVNACPVGSYHCANGRCINKQFLCDGEDDCGDSSDELDCPEKCHYYVKSSGDSIQSPNFPSKYGENLDCKWTLEGPEGHAIRLQFSEFDTEKNFDTVQIMGGGRTEESSVTMETLSGYQDLASKLFVSASNLMIIKFKSDASVEKRGFRASWKTEPQTCGGDLVATSQAQVLASPNYPEPYPGGLECVYTITTTPGKILTLEIEDLDLEPVHDYVLIRDGAGPSTPELVKLTASMEDNPKFVMSTGNKVYLYIHTDLGGSRKGFRIKYFSGCKVRLDAYKGEIMSPAFGSSPMYPANQVCTYHIRRPDGGRISLRFTDFVVDPSDKVELYDGPNENGIRLHPGDGFTGKSVSDALTLSAETGSMYVKFTGDPLRNAAGWRAVFSADCPSLVPGEGAIASNRDTSFGSQIKFTCPIGQEFATGGTEISTECQPGGKWSVSYIPKCQERYCGPVPQIDNGFAIGATNVTYKGQATYQCYAGFGFPSGLPVESITCTAEGLWEKLPTCLASQCPSLPEVAHATQKILSGGGRSYGTVVRFECEPGYYRTGTPVILCQSNGTWSGRVPSCSRVQCHDFPQIANGFIVNSTQEFFHGDEVRVQCHRGYQLVGSNTITCGPNQEFVNLPTCEDINECSAAQCDLASTECKNTPGAFHCQCKEGFRPNLDCRPVGDLGLSTGAIPDDSIKVSSEEEGYEKRMVRLNSELGWCGGISTQNSNWVIVDMRSPTILKGFRTRPVNRLDGSVAYASVLRLQYTDDLTDIFREYRAPNGAPVEFRILASNGPSVVNLPIAVEARYFRLTLQDYVNAPCLRLELNGCSRQDCSDVNECAKDNGGCDQRCVNSAGSFQCQCGVGFDLYTENGTAGFYIEQGETGIRDGDMYRINKTCVPKMCPALSPPDHGALLSVEKMFHFGDKVSFQCDFGYVMNGNPTLQCTSTGAWNGSVPTCEFAHCAALQDDPAGGLSVAMPAEIEGDKIPFGQNVTIQCNEMGKPMRKSVTSAFRQCVYDPKPGFPFDYWLSGAPPGCPRINCGIPPETPGANYGVYIDTRYMSSFFFGCEDTFSLAGQSSSNDNLVRCQEDGTWDFGDLRCEGPVCEDPSRPPDGSQLATSYEQGAEVSFTCDRPGYIPIAPEPIKCVRNPECRTIKPIGITSGKIPDSAINATTQRSNYEAKNIRLNSATGWCAQHEAFTYVSVDLGAVNRVKAILVKGVVTNDVVGRPTEIRFFYKRKEDENYVVYFPNFNLTARDPGNYGELAMITLPQSVQARFVILGIVSYDKNPCLKFELMGCSDEPESKRLLGYNMGYPACVDNEPPLFLHCPSSPIQVTRGPNGDLQPVNFTEPFATDNSGSVARTEVRPRGFRPPVYVFQDMMVEYLAYDYDGNVAICQINITVPDVTPPSLSCPQSYVIELVEPQDSYLVNFRDVINRVNVTDASNETLLTIVPESARIAVGAFENVTVVASDAAGNQAYCHFQVSVQPTPCVEWELKPPANGQVNCLPNEEGNGLDCLVSCAQGYRFTDGETVKTYNCQNRDPWKPNRVVPDCVPEDTELASYDVTATVTYRSNGVVSEECMPSYTQLVGQFYDTLSAKLSSRCSAINVNMNVTFMEAEAFVADDNIVTIEYVLRIAPAVRQPLLYDLCGSTLGLIFDLTVPSTSEVIGPLLNVSAVGNTCPPLRAMTSSVSRGFSCAKGDVLTKVDDGVPRCLYCPAGSHAAENACELCPRGTYQTSVRQAQCKRCPLGTYTREEGSKSLLDCIPVCGYGTYSPSGLVPCLECPRNSYSGEPPSDGFKECQLCPPKTFTYQPAAPGQSFCRAKCRPGTYSDTGLEPCAPCPRNFFQFSEGMTSCFECASNEMTPEAGSQDRATCANVQCRSDFCENGGLCISQGHEPRCYCPAGFTGRHCEVDMDDCASQPCYNSGTCVDLPQGYKCNCGEGYTGLQCQDESSDCDKNGTCPERAMCKNLPGIGNFECLCRAGYTGPDCNITVNPCTPEIGESPCDNNARCVPLEQGRYKCMCPPGWEGPTCSKNIDDCAETPCLLGANCTDLVNDFECACPNGFSGKRCELKVDLCQNTPCTHGKCVDALFDYSCVCEPGWTGKDCDENIDECESNPCENNSECVDQVDGFKCVCENGYTGARCQHTIDDCSDAPCQNGGTCVDDIDGFTCQCRPGYVGLQCEAEIDECQSNPCNPVGTEECMDMDNMFKCKCRAGFVGQLCETNVDECASNPCLNGGSCTDSMDRFVCSCPSGWTGDRCEKDIGGCTSEPCFNNADCVDLFQDYFCVCPSGTDGKQCEVTPMRCIGSPCMNGGFCRDFGSGLNCSCPTDFTGIGCQHEFDACKENVCQNGATCVDNGMGYECKCAPGYTGVNCEEDIPDCTPASCPPAATCIDLVNDFYCKCPFNLTGEDCRKTINYDYDLYLNDESRSSSASLAVPFPLGPISSMTVAMWVQFTVADEEGTFFTLYSVGSPHTPIDRKLLIQAHSSGVHIALFDDLNDLYVTYRSKIPVNDGQWHHIALTWDGLTGTVTLSTDAVIVASIPGYGEGKTLETYGWVTLGSSLTDDEPSLAESGFHGSISRVNIWSRPLDIRSEIPKQVLGCKNAPVLFDGLLLRWTGYDKIEGNVERISPAKCGTKVCPPGYFGPKCESLLKDKYPPRVDYCPSNIWVISKNGTAFVNWDPPIFSDNIRLTRVVEMNDYAPGQAFSWGTYQVAYVAYDEAGNSASCNFKIYVLQDFCPQPEDPVGGSQRCNDWGPGGRFKVCEISCNPGMKFSQEVPDFYTCGADGIWRPTQDETTPLVYPACASASPAQRVFKINMQFPTSVICNEAGQGVLAEKIKNALLMLNRNWRICSNTIRGSGSCNDLDVEVKCSKKTRSKRQVENDDVYTVEVSFPAVNDPATNVNSNDRASIRDLIEAIILEQNEFDVGEVLPNVVPDPGSLRLSSDYACPIGKVVVPPDCVDCAAGTFYDATTETCKFCPIGTFQNDVGQIRCKPCPSIAGKQGVTAVAGARSSNQCKERCLAGHYYDGETSLCRPCGYGMYQGEEGKFSCLPCGLGLTTRTDSATTKDECREECGSGFQLGLVGSCEPCPRGTYRTKGVDLACKKCPQGRTTLSTGAYTIEDCSLPICEAGTYLNSSLGNQCVKCPKGTYQSEAQKTSCEECPPNTSTSIEGATNVEECSNPCEVNGEKTLCHKHAQCFFHKEQNEFACVCMPGFEGNGTYCKDKCDGYCDNEGRCEKGEDGEPKCRCIRNFTGPRCKGRSEFAYYAGGIAAAVLLISFLVLLIYMIWVRTARKKQSVEPKKVLTPPLDLNGSAVNFYYGSPAPYAESIAPSHHSTYAHYYDDEEDGWEMPNFYNETYMKAESLHNGKMNSLARSNASVYGTRQTEDLYDRLRKHAYQGKKSENDKSSHDTTSDSDQEQPH